MIANICKAARCYLISRKSLERKSGVTHLAFFPRAPGPRTEDNRRPPVRQILGDSVDGVGQVAATHASRQH